MTTDHLKSVDEYIRESASQAAAIAGVSVAPIQEFLRTGEETWEGGGSAFFNYAQVKQDEIYTDGAKTAMRMLFPLATSLLKQEARLVPPVSQEEIQRRVEPMIRGLVPSQWQDTALREIGRRVFILNFPGVQAALDAEFSTGFIGTARKVLWAYLADNGLKPDQIVSEIDGVSAGEFAHVLWSAYLSADPYSDVVVHEDCASPPLPKARALRPDGSAWPRAVRGC
jgi:hypothetical protein